MPKTVLDPAEARVVLCDCVTTILEKMFFACVFGESESAAISGAPLIGAWVAFDGPLRGKLAIALESDLAKTLAADFLGLSSVEELDSAKAEEIIGELANMVCGATLSRIDDDALFSLAPPVHGPEAVALALSDCGIQQLLDIGEGALVVRLRIERHR